MRQYIFVIFFLAISHWNCAQSRTDCEVFYLTYFEEIDERIAFNTKDLPDTVTRELKDGWAEIVRLSCKGKAHIKKYRQDSTLEFQGQYLESLDVLSEYEKAENLEDGELILIVTKYYQPIPDGIWTYYNEVGKIAEKKFYNKGILQKETKG